MSTVSKKTIKSISFFLCILFICSNFKFKLAVIKATKIIEILNGDIYPKMNEYKIGDYTFIYDNQSSKDDILYAKQILDENKDYLSDFLNIDELPKVKIRLVSEFNESHNDSLGYVYFHNNILNILNKDAHDELLFLNDPELVDEKFSETLVHEYTHVLINHKFLENNSLSKELPFWLNEGIAEYTSANAINKNIPISVVSSTPPSELDDLFENNSDKFYEKSSIFVSSLVNNYGEDSIGLILDFLQFYDVETAIEKATFKDIDDISLKAFNTLY